jgi:hypothetical protein
VVTGYPLLFDSAAPDSPQAAINDATAELNCIIERAVAKSQATYANITYVDVTKEFALHGIVDHRSCPDSSVFIHTLLSCDPLPPHFDDEAFHPTDTGYATYADAISAALPHGWLNKQEPLA